MGTKTLKLADNLLFVPFSKYAIFTVTLPSVTLAYCFLSAYFFRFDEINDTDCNVSTIWVKFE